MLIFIFDFDINDRLSFWHAHYSYEPENMKKIYREHNISFKVDEPSDRETLKIVYCQNKE